MVNPPRSEIPKKEKRNTQPFHNTSISSPFFFFEFSLAAKESKTNWVVHNKPEVFNHLYSWRSQSKIVEEILSQTHYNPKKEVKGKSRTSLRVDSLTKPTKI